MRSDQPSRQRLAVLVVNYGSSDLLSVNLRSIAREVPDALIVVVDNRTDDDERSRVRALAEENDWVGIYPGGNLGFGGGMNLAAATALEAGATEVLLLNPDATIDADSVDHLRAIVREDPLTMVAPVVERPDGSMWSAGSDLYLRNGVMRSRRRRRDDLGPIREWLSGACLLLTAQLWRATGGFDEEYFLYWEDVDLSQRVLDAGGALRVVNQARAIHDEGATHRSEAQVGKSATYYYWNTRNRLRWASDHLPVRDRLRWLALSPIAAKDILLQGGRRQLLRPWTPVSSVVRGTVSGGAAVIRSLRP